MAYVKMHQIKATVGKAIQYVTRDDATMGGMLVSTNTAVVDPNDWRAIEAQFRATADTQVSLGAKGDVLAHHVIQSFKPGEIGSPRLAHEVGVEFAEKITRGQFEYVVATHLDKGHMHNHILMNAVSHTHGRKFRVVKTTLAGFRKTSDALCLERSLSVIQPRTVSVSPSIGEVYARARGASKLDALKVAIDRAVSSNSSWGEYELALRAQGVEVGRSQKRTITYRAPGMARVVRDIRLGGGYAEDQIMARLGKGSVMRVDVHESLVARSSETGVTVKVPGTNGGRLVAVNAAQVVRHGSTLRLYLPAEGKQAILDARGGIVAQVPTRALYVAFAPPERALIKVYGQRAAADQLRGSRALRGELEQMHAQESQLNTRARYGIVTAQQAVRQAVDLGTQLDAGLREIQTLAVAIDNAAPGSQERRDLTVRMAATQNRCAELQESAQALVRFASEVERDAESQVKAMTLQERLAGLSRADKEAVTGRPAEDKEVVKHLDRAQVDEDRGAEEKPARWAEMALKERTDWLRQRDERVRRQQQQQRRNDDNGTNGRARR